MFDWSSILTHSYTFLVDHDALVLYVHSRVFDEECAMYAKKIGNVDSNIDHSSDHSNLWEPESSSISSVKSSPHEVPRLEAYLYYFGLRGPRCWGPKLIFRTSKDVFELLLLLPRGAPLTCTKYI
jgi:hypothetical protein